MSSFFARLATAADNAAILALMSQPQPSNGVQFAFERLPNYFDSASVTHQHPHTIVIEKQNDKRLVAMVNMGWREVFVDGHLQRIRYG
ncbi:MAG TPA: hypothetical protein PKC11_11670, partial [Agitococcus sp.]|nr:hypothetical protein [Agitococcus sp.]